MIGWKCFIIDFARKMTLRQTFVVDNWFTPVFSFFTRPIDLVYRSVTSRFCPKTSRVHPSSAAMALTVSTGSDLIAKLRIRKTDVHAEQHILDLVQSIRQASSSGGFSNWFLLGGALCQSNIEKYRLSQSQSELESYLSKYKFGFWATTSRSSFCEVKLAKRSCPRMRKTFWLAMSKPTNRKREWKNDQTRFG